jgi:type II secretory pathway pseudopilin PulG
MSGRIDWCRSRTGFTVIELLVAIGIAMLLMALIVPAVQTARESARRLQCSDRLRQIMLATQAFESSRQHFPEYSSAGTDLQGQWHYDRCPLVAILPFIDQAEVYQRVDHNDIGINATGYTPPGGLVAGNQQFMALSIPLYRCPSDRTQPGSCNYRANLGTGANWSTSPPRPPFSACFDPKNGNGAFQNPTSLHAGDFADGLSNTAFYCERVIGDGDGTRFDPWRDSSQVTDPWPHCTAAELATTCRAIAGIAPKHASFTGFTWFYASKAQTAYDHILAPNSRIPDCARDDTGVIGATNSAIAARSPHSGIVNAVMGDGSVRNVSETIDLDVWHALGTRKGKD